MLTLDRAREILGARTPRDEKELAAFVDQVNRHAWIVVEMIRTERQQQQDESRRLHAS